MGDFNCKVGNCKKGNAEKITMGGKLLLKMIENEQLKLINSMDICEGKWTFPRNEENKSILDYAIITEEHSSILTQIIVDERKNIHQIE